jgi:hypothetical protein
MSIIISHIKQEDFAWHEDFDVLWWAKALGETGAAFRFCARYKILHRRDPSSVLCAAEVDSPFPRLLLGHFLWPL